MKKKEIKSIPVRSRTSRGCFFCDGKIGPDYKDVETLKRFVSDRGRIVGKDRSGVCSKHQRRLATEIKRARHLALLPFAGGV